MSKAFTKESDDVASTPVRRRGIAPTEPNYVTAVGLEALRAEAATTSDPIRARELADHLAVAVIGPAPEPGRVGFGSRVTVANEDDIQSVFRIVGAIEADPKHGIVSWQAPIALALYGAALGDVVQLPKGTVEVIALDPA